MIAVNDLDTPTSERERKTYATLAAQFAMMGLGLVKSDPAVEGQAPYYATRWGVMQPLADMDAARAYLSQVEARAR